MSWRYNQIPDQYLINKRIFEIGAGALINQRNSKLKDIIEQKDNYSFIDAAQGEYEDFLLYNPKRNDYEVILLIEVLEHIQIRDWVYVFDKIHSMLNENGVLIITTPYKEPNSPERLFHQLDKKYYMIHQVFNIQRRLYKYFFIDFSSKLLRKWVFRSSGESWVKCCLRHIKRIVTRSKLLKYGVLPIAEENLMIIVHKNQFKRS